MSVPRVLANLCAVVPRQVGGAEAYATRLLSAVASVEGPRASYARLEVAAMRGLRAAHPELASLRWHEAPWGGEIRWRRAALESSWLRRRSRGFDLVHHFSGRLPARRGAVAVLTVHDVQPLDMPENFSKAKQRYLGWSLPRSARSAALVTVPSQWVADRLADRLNLPTERVRVVPSTYAAVPTDATGAASGPRRPCEVAPSADLQEDRASGCDAVENGPRRMVPAALAARFDGSPFVLYPAATYPHKNHTMLIAAHAAARKRKGDLLLVLTGGAGRAHAQVSELVAGNPGVIHLGLVEETLLTRLMSAAAALVFPSRYEGFGLPLLEAMAAGTPVIAAACAAVPEVLGGAGTLLDPDDLDGWADALTEARDGAAALRRNAQAGLRRALDFAPERSARKLLRVWRDAHGLVS